MIVLYFGAFVALGILSVFSFILFDITFLTLVLALCFVASGLKIIKLESDFNIREVVG